VIEKFLTINFVAIKKIFHHCFIPHQKFSHFMPNLPPDHSERLTGLFTSSSFISDDDSPNNVGIVAKENGEEAFRIFSGKAVDVSEMSFCRYLFSHTNLFSFNSDDHQNFGLMILFSSNIIKIMLITLGPESKFSTIFSTSVDCI
jgi:hypothetical protein